METTIADASAIFNSTETKIAAYRIAAFALRRDKVARPAALNWQPQSLFFVLQNPNHQSRISFSSFNSVLSAQMQAIEGEKGRRGGGVGASNAIKSVCVFVFVLSGNEGGRGSGIESEQARSSEPGRPSLSAGCIVQLYIDKLVAAP